MGYSFCTFNAHGDVTALTNQTGSITKRYNYDAFGVETAKNQTDSNPFRYSGEYFDTETDSIYLRNRYYSPGTGRFLTQDPIMDGENWYVYANNNPIMFIDPFGLKVWLIHGTFSDPSTWTDDFITFLENTLNEEVELFEWTGKYDAYARLDGGNNLASIIENFHKENPDEPIRIVGHSHGGNVGIIATNVLEGRGIKTDTLVTVATPVMKIYNPAASIGQHINVYNKTDKVQINGAKGLTSASQFFTGRTYNNAENIEIYYEITNNWTGDPIKAHSYMHSNISVWKKYIIDLFDN